MNFLFVQKITVFVAILLCGLATANAATEDICGPNICYEYDDAQAAVSLFGTPTLIGDDMRFLPPAFKSQSIDGIGDNTGTNTDQLSGQFIFDRIYTLSGAEIGEITVSESGDYEIINDGSVSADLLILIANNNDAQECNCDFAEFDASGATSLALWNLQSSLDPSADFISVANDVSLSIQNTLSAFTDASGETAWIQKKISTVISVSVVPVPAAVWLFGSALGLLGWVRRKNI